MGPKVRTRTFWIQPTAGLTSQKMGTWLTCFGSGKRRLRDTIPTSSSITLSLSQVWTRSWNSDPKDPSKEAKQFLSVIINQKYSHLLRRGLPLSCPKLRPRGPSKTSQSCRAKEATLISKTRILGVEPLMKTSCLKIEIQAPTAPPFPATGEEWSKSIKRSSLNSQNLKVCF